MTKHSHFPYTSTCISTPHNTNRKHNIHPIPYTNTQHTSTLQGKKNYFQQRPLHNKHSHIPPHSHYNIHKTNMRHIHTSIVSRHLATRGNNNILRTPPPPISISKEILTRITCCTLAQLRTNKSPFLKSYLHKVDAKHIHHHYAPSVTSTRHVFNCTHIHTTLSPLDLWTNPAEVMELLAKWREKLTSGPQAGSSYSPPPH